jgi:hypothetical protein
MIDFSVEVLVDNAVRALNEAERAIHRGIDRGIQLATQEAVRLARPQISEDSGATRRRLRATYFRELGAKVGRVGVRAPRAHIMRFLEQGTKSHGRHGGPLPAHHILAKVKAQIEPKVPIYIEEQIERELFRALTGFLTGN